MLNTHCHHVRMKKKKKVQPISNYRKNIRQNFFFSALCSCYVYFHHQQLSATVTQYLRLDYKWTNTVIDVAWVYQTVSRESRWPSVHIVGYLSTTDWCKFNILHIPNYYWTSCGRPQCNRLCARPASHWGKGKCNIYRILRTVCYTG